MKIRYNSEPDLVNPVMVASWPGIGNIGLIAVDTLRRSLNAEEFASKFSAADVIPVTLLISR